MLADLKIPQDIFTAWRLSLFLFGFELIGGGVFLAFGIPSTSSEPPEHLKFLQFWCGAALAIPPGVAFGYIWQRIAASPIPKSYFRLCVFSAIVMPIFAVMHLLDFSVRL